MKTYNVYTKEGKSVGSVKGDELATGTNAILIRANGKIVAMIPYESGCVVLIAD